MSTTTPTRERPDTRRRGPLPVIVVVIAAALLFAAFALDGPGAAGGDTSALPNPMGGQALPAPGTASESATLGGLQVDGRLVEMGAVGLGVTYVPGWEVVNPTGEDVVVTVGQPQVLEGCCPGPVYADGTLIEPGDEVIVPAGGATLVQFPLQMHPGMDGWHDLAVPLQAGGEQAALQVTGDFTADASA